MKVNQYRERTIAFRPVNTYWNFTSRTGNQTVIDLMDRLWLARPQLDHLVGYLSPIFHGYAAKSGLVNLRDLSKKLLNSWVKRHDILPPFQSSTDRFNGELAIAPLLHETALIPDEDVFLAEFSIKSRPQLIEPVNHPRQRCT